VGRGAAIRLNARSQWWLSVGEEQPQDDGLPSRRPPRVRAKPPNSADQWLVR
jgi:hypothetical protein